MSIVKSFSVGDGDMFFIKHGSDNFTVIDCCIEENNREVIVNEIITESKNKGINRFISTHPDEDHIQGLPYLNDEWGILNFYVVNNEATKSVESKNFDEYCNLRDSDKVFHIYQGVSRKWMNQKSDERGSSGLSIIWPITSNELFIEELRKVKEGSSPNNISPILYYNTGVKVMWMGDIENVFHEKIKEYIVYPEIEVLFAPHHGRKSGKVPSDVLIKLNPKVIVIGEAPSSNLNYYQGYNTITQNSAGDISFDIGSEYIDVYVSNSNYSVSFLVNRYLSSYTNEHYLGSIKV